MSRILKIILLVSLFCTAQTAFAQPNYQYVILQPGQSYTNMTNQSQQIQIMQQDTQNYVYQQPVQQTTNYSYSMPNEQQQQNMSAYDKTRNTLVNATSTVNDAISLVRTLQSLKYSY